MSLALPIPLSISVTNASVNSISDLDNHNYIYAPLKKHKPIQNYDTENLWYDPSILKEKLADLEYYAILVDGPPSPNRAGLIKYWTLFNPKTLWIFDDVDRKREQKLIHGISGRLKRPYTIYNAWGEVKSFGAIHAE